MITRYEQMFYDRDIPKIIKEMEKKNEHLKRLCVLQTEQNKLLEERNHIESANR